MWQFIIEDDSSESEEEIERLPRTFRQRINTQFRTQYEFNERFRMTSTKMEELTASLGAYIDHPTNRNQALSVKLQLCVASSVMRLGSGGQYHTVADMHGISKASVCRAVHSTVDAVNQVLFDSVIKWPADIQGVITKFHSMARMPMVIGCVDGTLINIDAPQLNEEQYIDRHGKQSINCMAVCGPDCQFYYVSARWPGSVHDARVLRNSTLFQSMQSGWRPIPGAVILGDSGYPLLEWLLIPADNSMNENAVAINNYNRAHKSTRRIIENAFGILKEKFPCLNYLRVGPEFSCKIFKCCTTLCNISRSTEDEEYTLTERSDNTQENENVEEPEPNAIRRINEIIQHFSS